MWSPAKAPAAAATITSGSSGSPFAANTPAVITRLSLGTTGKKPSIAAKENSAR